MRGALGRRLFREDIVLCESAIDALSFLMLRPGTLCISTSGAAHNPRWLPHLLAQGRALYCAFDSDQAGDRHAATMLSLYPAIQRLRPRQHDWNDELRLSRTRTPSPTLPPRPTAAQQATLF